MDQVDWRGCTVSILGGERLEKTLDNVVCIQTWICFVWENDLLGILSGSLIPNEDSRGERGSKEGVDKMTGKICIPC